MEGDSFTDIFLPMMIQMSFVLIHWQSTVGLVEIFEFDAMDEPPSTMELEVFDFDGPFDEATSLGQAEINFVKSNLSELADIWIPLQGKLAQACQSKLHLRIFLNNTRGTDIVKDYLTKMEKELGKKVNDFSDAFSCWWCSFRQFFVHPLNPNYIFVNILKYL